MSSDCSGKLAVTMESFRANRFDAHLARSVVEAQAMILQMIPEKAIVGLGDSATLRQTAVVEKLAQRGIQVINPFSVELMRGMANDPAMHEAFLEMTRRTFRTDVLLTGCNAVTEDGKVVSIDGVGNRVAATVFGAPHVIITVGRNKIVKDVQEAIDRIKNVIAPEHAKRKGRRTPCVITGRCADCDSPQRMCNVTMIIEKKPLFTNLSIVLIDEDLGLGWDPAWNEEHISEIRAQYYAHTWAHELPKSS